MSLIDNYLNGMRLHVSPLAAKLEPKKLHKKTKSMSVNYHARIQKKWIKRFGKVMKPAMIHAGDTMVIHPDIWRELKEELKERGLRK